MLQNQEFIQEFVEEAIGHVESVETGLLKIDGQSPGEENINNIFRAVHSVKGTASFFGLKKIVELSHAMENILGEIRNGNIGVRPGLVDLLLASNDCLKKMIEDVNNSDTYEIKEYIEKLHGFTKSENSIEDVHHEAAPENPEVSTQVKITEANKEIIVDRLKHGHKLFKIQLNLNDDLGKKDIDPVQFIKDVQSIGNIIESYTDTGEIQELEHCLDNDIYFTFVFSTVLEKKLIPLALNIREDCIVELDVNTGLEELAKIVMEKNADNSGDKLKNGHTAEVLEKELTSRKTQSITVEDSVRVHVGLLNSLMNLASEMVLGRNQLLRAVEKYRKNIPGIEPILQNMDRITTEMQEKIMQTRMQPIGNVFNKFPRIIRDLSKNLEKEIDLKLEGTDVELDKSIIEALGDPLTHLVRNAADHGLEPPNVREKAGKHRVGSITLKAYHEGGFVNIDVIDDGAGVNIENIKKKAIEKELVSMKDIGTMNEQQILQFLFKPGFSTAEKITDVSGRGVGMDVVKTNIEKLGGAIEILTKVGEGTTFRLLLPLTLAIIPSLIVEVENHKFALPQVNLQEIVRIKPDDTTRKIEYIHNKEVLRLRGKLLPIVHLSDVLGLERTYIDLDTGVRMVERRKNLHDERTVDKASDSPIHQTGISCRRDSKANITRVLVLKIGAKKYGIAVDKIHESEEILVKPLPKYIKDCRCYSGVTIMGDGKTAMILDPEGITEISNLNFADGEEEKMESKDLNNSIMEQQNLLIFKCSGTETFAIDLPIVSRVEEIEPSEIEKVGNKEYIKFRGDSLRVIRLEDYLPVNSRQSSKNKQYIIIPKLVSHPIGIIIDEIRDTIRMNVVLNQEDMKTKGIIGSTLINNDIILLLNIYELFEMADPDHYSYNVNNKIAEKRVVLVAEDTPLFQRLEKNYLELAGYTVLTAKNGKEALQILQDSHVDAVVSDIHMPVMDGLELVKRIREDNRLKNLPVIAVTSMSGELQKKAGLNAGFDFYEFKLDRERLLEKLEQAFLERRKAI